MSKRTSILTLVAAAGMAASATQSAKAQAVVNISGATLFENFFKSQASTNDFIDVNGDGIAGKFSSGTIQDMSPYYLPPSPANQQWTVQYRATGSGNGLAEFVSFGQTFVTTADGVDLKSANAENAYYCGVKWKDLATGLTGIANTGNGGAAPVRSTMDAPRTATYAVPPTGSAGGVRIDLAVLDVPTAWFVTTAGTPSYSRKPAIGGYGLNPTNAVTTTGGATSQSNKLKSLGGLNINTGSPNANTVYDTQVAFVPIAPVANFGTGLTQIKYSDIRHGLVTGRMPTGENLVFVTRDAGSGTRNAYASSFGIDPGYGVGDNVGVKNDTPANNILGAGFLPNNKGGQGSMEATIFNHRLAVGYSGPERGINSGWLTSGRADILSLLDDVYGGTEYVRPTIDAIVDNGFKGQADPSGGTYAHDGWRVGGPETFASIGDPLAAPVAKGGTANGHPAIANVEAAAYLNNITQSIANFVSIPGGSQSLFMPGELLAQSFILSASTDKVQAALDATNFINNVNRNQALQDYVRSASVLSNPAYATFGTYSTVGKVPTRATGVTYSDGVVNGLNYKDQSGAAVFYGDPLTARNRVCGDFNNDGLRNLDDSFEIVDAYVNPGTWQSGTDAVREVLGDFNGDGSFDLKDLRYWADGLAVDNNCGNVVNRLKGFRALDDAFGGNLFGTTQVHGSYTSGVSAADVAGAAGVAPGWAPVGGDGTVNAKDIDYVYKQFRQNPNVADGQLNWDNLDEAAGGDFSCDINGDGRIDQKDVCLILSFLECQYGDVNLDGSVNATDRAIIVANLNTVGGWAKGDLDGSGTVDQADLDIYDFNINLCCPADFDANGFVNGDDFDTFTALFIAGDCLADWDLNGFVNGDDFDGFSAAFVGGC